MRKRIILVLLSIFCISMLTYGIDGWIRINQLGYLPNAQKKAILISESTQQIRQFSIYDALTNEELGVFNTVTNKGEFQLYQSTYILDFSTFKEQGAFYIKAGLIYSPTIYINKNTYLGTADFLLNFMRRQRCGYNPVLNSFCHQSACVETTGEEPKTTDPAIAVKTEEKTTNNSGVTPKTTSKSAKAQKKAEEAAAILEALKPKTVAISGGWHDTSDNIQNAAITAEAVYQLLFAYQMSPASFADAYDASGKSGSNRIPDILDEAKWGLDWLLKMTPGKDLLYHEIVDNRDSSRLVYTATGKPQGIPTKNHSTGIASIAGKYSAAFGLGAEVFTPFYPFYADSLKAKAFETYKTGKQSPGVCQAIVGSANSREEDNWSDDMELAGAQLYRLTYEGSYLKDAAGFGRMEPVSPWMCSDTARHYQWFPFINLGHYMLANVENPRYQKEFTQDLLNGLQRMQSYASTNPFNVGIPMIRNSNNLVVALATQCRLYRSLSNDSTYLDMENALVDWLFGRNPWGTTMVSGLPKNGITPTDPDYKLWEENHIPATGGLVSGPVQKKIYKSRKDIRLSKDDAYERSQAEWAVYHNDRNDYLTNEPTLDGTASLSYLLATRQQEGVPGKAADNNQYTNGGITRTDPGKKQISLVFTGNDFADGYKTIRKALKKLNIKASFFFTGDFYRNGRFRSVIKGLQADQHYLGGNSDKSPVYCSWRNRDSLLISKTEFLSDIKANYAAMAKFGIQKNQAPFFMPPTEQYNDSISRWCHELGIQLVSHTPGTLSDSDNSIPEMREKYFSTTEIYNKIIQVETRQGLNGHIMLFHLGTDKRRQDKFYPRLNALLIALLKGGYEFVDLYKATDVVDKQPTDKNKKQKRKN